MVSNEDCLISPHPIIKRLVFLTSDICGVKLLFNVFANITFYEMICNLLIIFIRRARPQKYVWHGADINGNYDMDSNCDLWNTDSQQKTGSASSLNKNNLLLSEILSCNNRLIVLCIEGMTQQSVRRRRRRRHHSAKGYQNDTKIYDHSLYDNMSHINLDNE